MSLHGPQRLTVKQALEYYSAPLPPRLDSAFVPVRDMGADLIRNNDYPTILKPIEAKSNALSNHALPLISVGSKVEYLSNTMNGWVLSYVKGLNEDGTYHLNTKKSANPDRVRLLLTLPTQSSGSDKQYKEHPPCEKRPILGGPFLCSLIYKSVSAVDLSHFRADILALLGSNPRNSMTRMSGLTGGQNEGVWYVMSGRNREWCLKLVKSGRKIQAIPSERETFLDLVSRFPGIRSDPGLCFPQRIIELRSEGNLPIYEAVCMPVALGERMAEVVGRISKDSNRLEKLFRAVGQRLRQFHADYGGTQHGDLQCGNVFVRMDDLVRVTFIDLGGMGTTGTRDVEYFTESIGILAKTYGWEFQRVSCRAFLAGYNGN
jgi:hypothetical protein